MSCREKSEVADFRSGYASAADFCEVLERELAPLYQLAFVLTANRQHAEQCFGATVEEAFQGQTVFKDWVGSWLKRNLIKKAIGVVFSGAAGNHETDNNAGPELGLGEQAAGDGRMARVIQLPPWERFVFVMSILERYSIWDCSVLLNCSPKNVSEYRERALRRLSGPVGVIPRVEAQASSLVQSLA
jgi:DNA-directed RNA polymerase specialized sigma24 family protein